MNSQELLEQYNSGCRDFSGANLSGANLTRADLTRAYLASANLARANLAGADLTGANLTYANLHNANLTYAYLTYANLAGANLTGTNLTGAYLTYANLTYAYLTGANLTNTCLDPKAPIPRISDAEILAAGLEIRGDEIWGWRTKESQVVRGITYESGKTYVAPWFSVAATDCHPGIYLAGTNWLEENYSDCELVQVHCLRSDLHKAGNKFRCRKLVVV